MKIISTLLVLLASLCATVLDAQTTAAPCHNSGYWFLPDAHKHHHYRLCCRGIDPLVLCRVGELYAEYTVYGCDLSESSFH